MNGDGERMLLIDASVLITLAGVGRMDLLAGLDGTVAVPRAVREETRDDPAATHLAAASDDGWLTVVDDPPDLERAASHLGRDVADAGGDVALLAIALERDVVVVTDDKPLRNACKALSVPVSGSIGVLIRAVERGAIEADNARASLYAMDEVGARLSASLVRRAEQLIEDATESR